MNSPCAILKKRASFYILILARLLHYIIQIQLNPIGAINLELNMTISNSNLQSVLLPSPDVAAEGLIAGQIQGQAIIPETGAQSFSEGEFWSMLSQQLTDITSQNDMQVIEDKDLLALFSAFEAELENTENTQSAEAQWMHILKSHFNANDYIDNDYTEIELADGQSKVLAADQFDRNVEQDEQSPLFAALTIAQTEVDVEIDNGAKLPRIRQNLSAEIATTVEAGPNLMKSEKIDVSVKTEAINNGGVEADQFPLQKQAIEVISSGEVEAKEMVNDKPVLKQPVLELNPAKESGLTASMQVSQPVSMLQQPQASTQLPTALQSLQLTPQAQHSEWGESLGERVSFLINNKLNSAEIRIDPPHLGKLDIQIQVREDSVLVVINTQNAQTRDLIDSASVRLREFLQEAGYNSVDVNVSHREHSMQQGGFAQQDTSTSDESIAGQQQSDEEPAETHQTEMYISTDTGRIDYFA